MADPRMQSSSTRQTTDQEKETGPPGATSTPPVGGTEARAGAAHPSAVASGTETTARHAAGATDAPRQGQMHRPGGQNGTLVQEKQQRDDGGGLRSSTALGGLDKDQARAGKDDPVKEDIASRD